MNREEMITDFADFIERQRATLLNKNKDYASADALSNFKSVAHILNTTPEKVALTLIGVKLARLGVLLNSDKTPGNESIQDSVSDLANYSYLLNACLKDKT